ncbi:MAG: hypothetical protein ACKVQT_19175 [Burkholderiales bacterium]
MTYAYPKRELNGSHLPSVNRAIATGIAAWLLVLMAIVGRVPDSWTEFDAQALASEQTIYKPPPVASIESIGSTVALSKSDSVPSDDHP